MSRIGQMLHLVEMERVRQDEKWGAKNILFRSNTDALVVLMEEVGECAKAHLEKDLVGLHNELIQVAAVAVAAAEGLANREAKGHAA